MKPILMNGITLTRREIYGVQRMATELLCALDGLLQPGRLELAVPEKGARQLHFENIRLVPVAVDSENNNDMRAWNLSGLTRLAERRGAIPADLILAVPPGGCGLVAIHDCTTERCTGNVRTLRGHLGRLAYMLRVKSCLARSRIIMTVSSSARDEIAHFYRIPVERIRVIPNAWQHFERVEPDESVLDRLGLRSRRYFFALGSRYYHKNYRWIVAAARQNPQDLFVVSGSSNLSRSDEALADTPENLIYAGYLSDGEVKALMSRCAAFLQPSLYEGFGMPPMEAMSAGARCIVSDIPALREVYGEAVWYIDPLDYAHIDLEEIMRAPLSDSRTVLDAYSWEKSARQLKALLDELQAAED